LAELNGQGVLFSASGGTGKSTTCRRLPDYWKPLCDDETLVVLDSNKEYRAHPFPTWSDYLMKRAPNTWDVQYSVPVSAIFFLERADNDEVTHLSASEVSVLMMESASQVCVHNKTLYRQQPDLAEFRKKLFNNACNLAMKIPAFRLRISLNGKFWEEVENVLKHQKI
jgi:SynChlorMet cassette protein ScmC